MVSTIAKDEIAKLPNENFPGRIVVVQTEKETDEAVAYLEKYETIGFDTETRPAFQKGTIHPIALIQLSTEDTCFLFRLNLINFPPSLLALMVNKKVRKIGLSLKDDFAAMRKRVPLIPSNFIELQAFVKQYGIEDNSLQRIYAILFDKKISKRQRLSNWEAATLSDAQKMYAALDAWACLQIYETLRKMGKSC